MLDRLFRRRPLQLAFQQRECVVVPQTASRVALHADVHFAAWSGRQSAVIEDAYLLWLWDQGRRRPLEFRRSRWDRAVIDGRFRYPPEPLAVAVSSAPIEATLTFTDPLIPHDEDQPPPPQSLLALEIRLQGEKPVRQPLWRLEHASWSAAATAVWLVNR